MGKMTSNILVTGGVGFIGSHVVRTLLAQEEFTDYRTVVLDDLSGGSRENVQEHKRIEFIKGSITNKKLVENLFQKKHFKYVYHLAAYAAEGLSHFIRRFNYTNNLIGSVNLINAAVNYGSECFVFTSSIAVYGATQVPMREDMVPQPEDPYGISKYAVELDLKAAHEMFGLDYIIFRPHNVYGEYQNIGDKYRNVVGIFMNQILQGKPMTIFGDGEQQRAFSYIGDIAPIIARAPIVKDARNRIFNIGADKPYTVNELAQRVAEAMGAEASIVHVPSRNEVYIAFSDHSACQKVFGLIAQTPLEEGLHRMSAWVKTVGARKSKEFREIEIPSGLPKSWLS
jgi:UDP-glucose 4-epimerase